MKRTLDCTRRDFLAISAAAGVGLLTAGRLPASEFKTKLHKSLIGVPSENFVIRLSISISQSSI